MAETLNYKSAGAMRRKPHTVIAMDGQGNIDWRDGQEFASEEVAQRVADGLNHDAERNGSDWFYMAHPAA